MVAVTDTGAGMPPEILERVFDPFFTTKPEGEGTGLGLSMVHGFVKQSGGHIKVYSEVGHGTTARIYLPRSRHPEDILTEVEAGPAKGGTELVLVVEDDEDVRATAAEMLAELGYQVLKAKDADSAMAVIESGIAIDVLFTDVVMPENYQYGISAKISAKNTAYGRSLYLGYTDNAMLHRDLLDEGADILNKPYTREELARKLRQVLRKPD